MTSPDRDPLSVSRPARSLSRDSFSRANFASATSTPFGRLALTHSLSLGGDALVAMSLAGSLFFDVNPSAGRQRIALYLFFTMAPFALVGPLIGPAMDRAKGGHRMILIGSTVGRTVVAFVMVSSVAANSLWLFPEAFLMLVMSKSYQVAKAAIVPTVVTSDAGLVEANSKLQLLSGLSGFAAGIPGGLLLLVSPGATVFLAGLVFAAGSVASLRVPATTVAKEPADEEERAELRSAGVLSAASAMGSLRAIVGFVTFLLAFALRGNDTKVDLGTGMGRIIGRTALQLPSSPSDVFRPGGPPAWHFGVVVALSIGGGLLGAAVAPVIRRHAREELLLLGSMGVAVIGGVMGLVFGDLFGQAMMSFCIAVAASAGKQAFDAVVQRDAPGANRGRSFARFESRFQVAWVLGAFVPVLITMPVELGGAMVAALAAAAGIFFFLGMQAMRRGEAPPQVPRASEVSRRLRRRATARTPRRRVSPPGEGPGSPEPPTSRRT